MIAYNLVQFPIDFELGCLVDTNKNKNDFHLAVFVFVGADSRQLITPISLAIGLTYCAQLPAERCQLVLSTVAIGPRGSVMTAFANNITNFEN